MIRENFFVKLILWVIFLVLLVIATYGLFFIWKTNKIENKIIINSENNVSVLSTFKNLVSQKKINLRGMEKERINILLLGVAGQGKPGGNLTDTIMIISINTKTNQVALLSIPRDLYVEIPSTHFKLKINSVYNFGIKNYPDDEQQAIEPVREVIKNITSLDIDYWAILNFDGFIKTIDAIGGINITNQRDIYDPSYPGPNYSYETFELKKGLQHLDGATALKYARMRHNDPEGDFGRAKRQQQVMQATKNKIFSTQTFLNVVALNNLFNALGDNAKTNVSHEELDDFLKLLKKIDTDNINNVVIDAWDKNSLTKVSHIFYENVRAFVLIPRIGNWSEIKELSENIFDINTIKKRREEISKENATVTLINKSGNKLIMERINDLLKNNFDYKNVVILSDSNPSTEEKSFVYDLTNKQKPFTLDELTKKLPVQISPDFKDNYKKIIANIDTDLVIIIGKDLIEKYSMELNTIEEYNNANEELN